uniref:Tetraspanin n=1 Tax=Lotharella globosa TaxID=91324 RepID=A0A6V3S4E1_9EUKA
MAAYRRERRPKDVSCCSTCCRWIQGKLLLLINLVDFIGGVGIMAFGFYVFDKKYAPDYVYIPLASIGLFVICIVLFSCMGAGCWRSCWACCLYPLSGIMGLMVAIGEIVAGSLLLAYHKKYTQWLDDNQQKYNINDGELKRLKDGVTTVAVGFFALAFLEVLRFCVSKGYKRGKRYDEEQRNILAEYEELESQERAALRSQERKEKHKKLREHYKQKYNL